MQEKSRWRPATKGPPRDERLSVQQEFGHAEGGGLAIWNRVLTWTEALHVPGLPPPRKRPWHQGENPQLAKYLCLHGEITLAAIDTGGTGR